MKIIIAGSRSFNDYELLCKVCDFMLANQNESEIEIVSGACDRGIHTFTRTDGTKIYGADGLAEKFAQEKKYKFTPFPADWSFGKKGAYIRNKQMSEYGDALIAFMEKKGTKGTQMMIDLARAKGLKVRVSLY